MLKTTKKQLRHNKKKRETRKKMLYKKSKTLKGKGRRKHLNLKKRSLKKQRGGVNPSDLPPELAPLHQKLQESQLKYEKEQAALKRQQHSEFLESLVPGGLSEVRTMLTEQLPNEDELVEEVSEMINEDPEVISDFPVDETIDKVVPMASNKQTLKQRLSDSLIKIGQKLKKTFKKRPKEPKPVVLKKEAPSYSVQIDNPMFNPESVSTDEPLEKTPEPLTSTPSESYEMVSSVPTETSSVQQTSFSERTDEPLEKTPEPLTSTPSESYEMVSSVAAENEPSTIKETSFSTLPSEEEPTSLIDEVFAEEPEMLQEYEVIELESPEDTLNELDADLSLFDGPTQNDIISRIGDELDINEPTQETIEAEIKKPEKRGLLFKLSEKIKNLVGKISFSKNKPKETEVKDIIDTKLAKYPELKTEMDKLNLNAEKLFKSMIENRETTERIFERLNLTSTIKDQQRLKTISKMLDDFRHEVLSETINKLNADNEERIVALNDKIKELMIQNQQLNQGLISLSEEAKREKPVIVEKVNVGITDDDMKKIASILVTDKDKELINKAETSELKTQVSNLVEQVRELTQQLQTLKALKESETVKPWLYSVEPSEIGEEQPEIGEKQPEMVEEQPEMGEEQPEMKKEQPEMKKEQPEMKKEQQPEQVIHVSPEQLLDNKTIVIKIMMPRTAQIDTASETGNTAEEQISSIVSSDKNKEVETSATKLIQEQQKTDEDLPPPYSEKPGGNKNKNINPAKIHPASLFN